MSGALLPKGKSTATMTVAELKAALQSRGVKVKSKALKADLVDQLEGMLSEEMHQSAPANQQAGPDGSAGGSVRSVTIPTGIEHVYFPLREPVSLPDKLDALFMALTLDRPKAPIVFLPDGTSVASAVSSLQRAGFMQSLSLDAATTGRTNVADLYTSALRARRDQNADDSKHATPALPILVACESAARGLHLDGIDAVYVLARPKTADEYLHLAGRTGKGLHNVRRTWVKNMFTVRAPQLVGEVPSKACLARSVEAPPIPEFIVLFIC
jgi:superfamily II DNA/RNA helicase